MRDISEKSTGQLVDELITNAFKTAFAASAGRPTEEFEQRYRLLSEAIDTRWAISDVVHRFCISLYRSPDSEFDIPRVSEHKQALLQALLDLCRRSLDTWQLQEIVINAVDPALVARAAKDAQRCNALRTAAIREIDRQVGESDITITTKTYG